MAGVGKNIAKAQQNAGIVKDERFSSFMQSDAVQKKVREIVGGQDGQNFITSIISAVSINPKLAECENSTILSAGLQGVALKLSPSPVLGQFYIIPYENKKSDKPTAQFQIGYKGYIQLAIRSGYYKKLNVLAIKQGELISYDPLAEDIQVNLIEDEEEREKAPTIGYYAFFEYHNGFRKSMYWSKSKMEHHANTYSKAFNLEKARQLQAGKIPRDELWKYSSFWYKSFDAMARKTMLRQLISQWGIMSIELQKAIELEQEQERGYGVESSGGVINVTPETKQIEATATTEATVTEPETAGGEYVEQAQDDGVVNGFFKAKDDGVS